MSDANLNPDKLESAIDQDISSKSPKEEDGQAELSTAIDKLLDTVGSKFTTMSKDIMAQMDAMSARLDELEAQAKATMQTENKRESASS